MAETLGAALARAAALAQPDAGLRFLDRHERETWFDWPTLVDRARRAAGVLEAAGVRPGERVGIILPTDPLFADAFFGCVLAGAVPVPLYPPVRLGRLDEYLARTAAMLRAAGAVALVSDRRVRRLLGQVVARAKPRCGLIPAEDLPQGPPVAPLDRDPGDLAMVQFSSGTTRDPKPVPLTHAQVLANTDAILDFMPPDAPWTHVGVSWLPLYHDMGLIGCIFPALRRPGPLTLLPPEAFLARPALWLRAIGRYRGTVSPAPNFAYALCAQRVRDEEIEAVDLSSWRLALNGAEPVSAATLRAFADRFSRWGLRPEAVTPVYGLSEAALAVTFSDPNQPAAWLRLDRAALAAGRAVEGAGADTVEVVDVGRPVRGFAVEVRGPGGAVLPEGRVGRIWVRGPSLMHGYLDHQETTIVDGWLDTGDQGFLRHGSLFVTGREKDVVVLRGQNHLPQDIEAATDEVAGVRTGCTAAISEIGEHGEHLLVFVEARQPSPDLAAGCRSAVLARTGLDPALVVVLEPGTLPRTSSGKIRRRETLARWRAGTLLPPAPVTPWRLAGALAHSALGYLGRRTG